ncbi:hypothetical protein J6590_031536 [Homalodisca vitripennis]|nr:hypothetical protein J6590_031536 [Homalodisca vitripennis]
MSIIEQGRRELTYARNSDLLLGHPKIFCRGSQVALDPLTWPLHEPRTCYSYSTLSASLAYVLYQLPHSFNVLPLVHIVPIADRSKMTYARTSKIFCHGSLVALDPLT